MTTASVRIALALLVVAGIRPALAEHEDAEAHAKGTTQTITLDGSDVRPATLNMAHGDILAFVNYSTHPVEVTFTEPSDLEKKIRCGLVHGTEKNAPSAPWALFTWKDGKLVGTLPPGKFASVCSLEPGSYAYTATIIGLGQRARDPGSVLPAKGQIEVK